jgi:hypothetical protein
MILKEVALELTTFINLRVGYLKNWRFWPIWKNQ